ncbi:hypothetical protein LR48_Vigan01g168200 [Vigna angularis]|uniref:Knottin scorpion toxin-like domain-containing protein n=2 Tax=Phaseolus angularis TaxID=3914 RepID=A0A0L9TNU4_PHAAN|nr:hypothetical protein LR48_Vigan01g168200 [Vigna angularis]BAT75287.1 hypothetical protein VIGAN_01312600 [Vigna angularis var. angularis]
MAENLAKMLTVILVVTAVAMEAEPVDSAVAIPMYPCSVPECIAGCKKILGEKFRSASCLTNGNNCICFS